MISQQERELTQRMWNETPQDQRFVRAPLTETEMRESNGFADSRFGQFMAWLGEHEAIIFAAPVLAISGILILAGADIKVAAAGGVAASAGIVFLLEYSSAH